MSLISFSKRLFKTLFYLCLLLIPALFLQYFADTALFHQIESYVENYWLLYVLSIIFLKSISIVYPPLPGVAASISAIPFIGWQQAYILDLIGSFIGVSISYFLGKRYGLLLLKKVLGEKLTKKISNITLKDKNQVEAVVVLRIAAGGILTDGLAWGASIIGFSYKTFIIGHIIAHLLTTIPVFFLLSVSTSVESWIGVALAAILAWGLIFTFKGRYFE